MDQISILLIPGAFGLPEFYQPVIEAVVSKGFAIQVLHLPTVGPTKGQGREGSELPTMYDDAAYISKAIASLADASKKVILVAHSYGGVPTTQSILGLRLGERRAEGKRGGVVHLAYMTALVPALGCSAADVLSSVPDTNRDKLESDSYGWMYHANPAAAAALSFSDLPSNEGEAWIRRFPRHSGPSFTSLLTHAGYTHIGVSYLVCENDLTIPVQIQEAAVDMIRRTGSSVNVTRIPRGHCPMVSDPQGVASWIVDLATKTLVSQE